MDAPNNNISAEIRTVSIMPLLLFVVMGIAVIAGLVRLLSNWEGFGSRAWPMLIVTFVLPFGALWPLFAKLDDGYYNDRRRGGQGARRTQVNRRYR